MRVCVRACADVSVCVCETERGERVRRRPQVIQIIILARTSGAGKKENRKQAYY